MKAKLIALLALAMGTAMLTSLANAQDPDCNCRYTQTEFIYCQGDPETCPLEVQTEHCDGTGSCQACLIGYGMCCDTPYTVTTHGNCNGQGTKLKELLQKGSAIELASVYLPNCTGGFEPISSSVLAKLETPVPEKTTAIKGGGK